MRARTVGRAVRSWWIANLPLLPLLLLPLAVTSAFAFEPADVNAIVGNTRAVEANPGARGLWMGRQRTVEIDGVGNAVITEHLLARVIDPSWGRERFSPYRRVYWGEYTGLTVMARTWKSREESHDVPADSIRFRDDPLGKAESAYHFLRDCTVSVPPPASGDVVELILRWDCPIPAYDRNVRSLEETFGADVPVIEQQLILITPAAMVVDTASIGPGLRGQTLLENGMRTTTWINGNLPPVPARLVETPWLRVPVPADTVGPAVTRIVVSTMGTWNFVGKYFGLQWEDAWTSRSSDIDRMAQAAMDKGSEPRTRAEALAEAVRARCRTVEVPDLLLGMKPPAASLVAMGCVGGTRDKAVLLVTALRTAGLEAVPVLVRERRDPWSERVSSLAQLDRWVVRAGATNGELYWLDPAGSDHPLPPGRGLLLAGRKDRPELQDEAGLVDFPGLPATKR